MGIYGNVYKPIEPISELSQGLITITETKLIREAEELGLFSESKFNLSKLGDSSEYKKVTKDLKVAEQILNANDESIDVDKVGHTLLHGLDVVSKTIKNGTAVASKVNPVYLPVFLCAKLVNVAIKHGKEQEALGFANEAISKLYALLDAAETDVEKQRIQGAIDKLENSKHTLEIGKKTKRRMEKAVKKEDRILRRMERKNEREDRRALKKAAKKVKKGKDIGKDDDDEVIDDVADVKESSYLMDDFIDFCDENGIEINDNILNIVEGCCRDEEYDYEDADNNDRDEMNKKIVDELTSKKESAITSDILNFCLENGVILSTDQLSDLTDTY